MDDQISVALVEEKSLVSGIVIPNVVLDLLPIPFQCAEFRIERNDRVGVEIIAFPIPRRYEPLPTGLRAMTALLVLRNKAIKPLLSVGEVKSDSVALSWTAPQVVAG